MRKILRYEDDRAIWSENIPAHVTVSSHIRGSMAVGTSAAEMARQAKAHKLRERNEADS